ERRQGLRRRPERRPPPGLRDRLRRHAHGRRLHREQPERRRGVRLRLELPNGERRGPGEGLRALTHRPAIEPVPDRSRRQTGGFLIPPSKPLDIRLFVAYGTFITS